MARLLAAEIGPEAPHLLEHVAVADGGSRHLEPERRQGPLETEVRHHRRDHDAALERAARHERPGAGRENVVAVSDGAGLVDHDEAVAVAVEREAERPRRRADARLEPFRMERPHAAVDVRPGRPQCRASSTSAPSDRNRRGATRYVAPCAQSSTSLESRRGRSPPAGSPGGPPDSGARRPGPCARARSARRWASVRPESARSRASISSSQASGSLSPSLEKSFTPLSSNGLWDADSTAPARGTQSRESGTRRPASAGRRRPARPRPPTGCPRREPARGAGPETRVSRAMRSAGRRRLDPIRSAR